MASSFRSSATPTVNRYPRSPERSPCSPRRRGHDGSTVNNYGSLGSPLSTPIIPPGQSANLGFGRLQERAVVRDGEVVVRPVLGLSCSGDHRVLDGADLAAYVNDVCA